MTLNPYNRNFKDVYTLVRNETGRNPVVTWASQNPSQTEVKFISAFEFPGNLTNEELTSQASNLIAIFRNCLLVVWHC
ncbi:hypothetical protein ACOSQ2_006522 [Xanthoceras sorbifolium]